MRSSGPRLAGEWLVAAEQAPRARASHLIIASPKRSAKMAAPEITDNPAKLHYHRNGGSLNLPHPAAQMKLMEGISGTPSSLPQSLSDFE